DGCTIAGNKAVMGGGIHAGGHASIQLNGTKLIGNEAEFGSALYVQETNHSGPYGLILENCTIRKNKGKSALSIYTSLFLKDTVITNNEGYGIRTSDDGSYVNITGNTIVRSNDFNLGIANPGIVKVKEFTGPKEAIGITYTKSKSDFNVLPFYGKDAIDITAPSDTNYNDIFFSDDKRFMIRSHPNSEKAIYQNVAQLYIPPHRHRYNEKWSTDLTHHWGVCYCGEEGPKQLHFPRSADYSSNCLKCTRKYAEISQKYAERYGEQPKWNNLLLLIAGCSALMLSIAVVLFILRKKKR
ncbi:MAG: hypothetical protein IJD13_01625, partial [Oscillospiraceae bacterium]|nr:hypothetical protein [Oscillospiraceae bacterium]